MDRNPPTISGNTGFLYVAHFPAHKNLRFLVGCFAVIVLVFGMTLFIILIISLLMLLLSVCSYNIIIFI